MPCVVLRFPRALPWGSMLPVANQLAVGLHVNIKACCMLGRKQAAGMQVLMKLPEE